MTLWRGRARFHSNPLHRGRDHAVVCRAPRVSSWCGQARLPVIPSQARGPAFRHGSALAWGAPRRPTGSIGRTTAPPKRVPDRQRSRVGRVPACSCRGPNRSDCGVPALVAVEAEPAKDHEPASCVGRPRRLGRASRPSEAKNVSAAALSAETRAPPGPQDPGAVAGVGERLRPVLSLVIAVEIDAVHLSAASPAGRVGRVDDRLGTLVFGNGGTLIRSTRAQPHAPQDEPPPSTDSVGVMSSGADDG